MEENYEELSPPDTIGQGASGGNDSQTEEYLEVGTEDSDSDFEVGGQETYSEFNGGDEFYSELNGGEETYSEYNGFGDGSGSNL